MAEVEAENESKPSGRKLILNLTHGCACKILQKIGNAPDGAVYKALRFSLNLHQAMERRRSYNNSIVVALKLAGPEQHTMFLNDYFTKNFVTTYRPIGLLTTNRYACIPYMIGSLESKSRPVGSNTASPRTALL